MNAQFFIIFLFWKGLFFSLIILLILLPCNNLMFVCSSVLFISSVCIYVAMQQFNVCLFICLNICLRYKSYNWSFLTKFGYVFSVSNLSLHTKNCDLMINHFYGSTSKSWIFIFIYVLLALSLHDNNIKTRMDSITDF